MQPSPIEIEQAPTSFFELFGHLTPRQLLADWQLKPIDVEQAEWAHFPSPAFIAWAQGFPRQPFDAIPAAEHHRIPPSFLLSQTHRIWLSARLVVDNAGRDGRLVDFGSFPFSVPFALRDFFGYRGPITATAIQPAPHETRAILDQYRIQLDVLDLDPFVTDPARGAPPPSTLACEAGSVDVVTMFHVIEHLYHPMETLREAHRILREGGHLIITTDNPMMLTTFAHYLWGTGYLFEPVQNTCAMAFHDWRGHVRFFTADELRLMAEAAGFSVVRHGFEQVFYDVFHDAYFVDARPSLPGWQQTILQDHRQFANDVFLVAAKVAR